MGSWMYGSVVEASVCAVISWCKEWQCATVHFCETMYNVVRVQVVLLLRCSLVARSRRVNLCRPSWRPRQQQCGLREWSSSRCGSVVVLPPSPPPPKKKWKRIRPLFAAIHDGAQRNPRCSNMRLLPVCGLHAMRPEFQRVEALTTRARPCLLE